MSVDYIEYFAKLQEQGLAAVKQAQDASLAALTSFREIAAQFPTNTEVTPFAGIPTPAKAIEQSFDFASKLLELRKQYALHVAELLVSAQKAATEAAVRAAKAATNET